MQVDYHKLTVSKPYHSESRTIWYVHDGDECIGTLEFGQRWRSGPRMSVFVVVGVAPATGMVLVRREDERDWERDTPPYAWSVHSLFGTTWRVVDESSSVNAG